MNTARRHALPQRCLSWLLGLALLLPMAQTAAQWHLLSHLGAAQAGQPAGDAAAANPSAAQEDHCALCLMADAVTGGALAMAPFGPIRLDTSEDAPPASRDHLWFAPAERAYQSRAPPTSPH